MNNTSAVLLVSPSNNLSLMLQSNPGVGLQWHFTNGSGPNNLGFFTVEWNGAARINCRDNQRLRNLMVLEGIASRGPDTFPFLMSDQTNHRSGTLNILVDNLPLARGTYSWTVYQVVP
jgi:hypothetical protein